MPLRLVKPSRSPEIKTPTPSPLKPPASSPPSSVWLMPVSQVAAHMWHQFQTILRHRPDSAVLIAAVVEEVAKEIEEESA